MSTLRDYVRLRVEMHRELNLPQPDPFALLVEHGEDGTFTPLPESEDYGQAKNCYGNSADRVLLVDWMPEGTPKLTYYEGVANTGVGPIQHAWCQDDDGRVYDRTLRHLDTRCGFCLGDGEVGLEDHWDWDGEEVEDPDETVTCEQCDGTGETEPVDRSSVTYLGVPVGDDTLRRLIVENGVYGALFQDPRAVAAYLGVSV